MTTFSSPRTTLSRFLSIAAIATTMTLAGCGSGMISAAADAVQGSVQGGLQPVSGATIQVYAASTKGTGTAATKMLSTAVSTNSKGSFSLPSSFKCINASDQIYAVATGGNPGGGMNSSLALMSDLGICGNLKSSTPIYINEVTTIASVYALAKYMNASSFDVASSSSDASSVAAAYTAAGTLANLGTGSAVVTNTVYKKLNSLADSLATCVNSSSDSAACKKLFAAATPANSPAPTNTVAAVLNISQNPTSNVDTIYNLASVQPFQPTLSASPSDWILFGGNTPGQGTQGTTTVIDPVISWTTPAPITYGMALSAAQLDATASVPGTFTYSPALGTIPQVGSNTLSVTFVPTDTIHYSTKSATATLVVTKAAATVNWATPAAITYGTSLSPAQLNATASIPGTFVYSPAAGSTPTVGTQRLTATFTPTDTVNYGAQTASVNLVIGKATPTITWPAPSSISTGTALSTAQLNAASSVSGNFTYSPAAGTVLQAGTTTLTTSFTPLDTANYTTATKSVSISVAQSDKKTPTITWAAPAAITYGTALTAAQLNAASSVPGTFTYSPAIGAVPAVGTDTLSVTFTPTDSTMYSTATATVSLVVNKTSSLVTWANPAPIAYGTALSSSQLNASASVPGSFAYSPAVGATPPAGSNTLTVTFTPSDTTNYSTSTATATLQVNKATPSISWNTPDSITYGTALSASQLNASSSVAGSFSYSPAIGTVLGSGTQTLSTTFTPTDTNNYLTATKSVALQIIGGTSAITWAAPAAITYGTALSAAQLNATASVAGTFTYNPAVGATLDAGVHSLSVTFTPNDTTNYKTQTSTVSLTVNQATPKVNWNAPANLSYGTVLSSTQLNATASIPGTFVYTPSAGSTLSTGTTSLSVLFTPEDSANYTSTTKTVSVTVGSGSAVVSWPNPAAITYGTALSATQLNATSSVPGTLTYSPAIGTVLTAGTQTLKATFTPNDTTNYSTQTVSASLVVNQATPTITWAAPAAIVSGTALSSTQLNATASVAGSFVYSPVAGTVLPTGTSSLSATFTPTDTTNYSTQTATVSQVVTGLPSQPSQTTPTITWATPSAIAYGTALSSAQLNATANVAGTFTYSPAVGTLLAAGTRTLSVIFTPSDSAYSTATASVALVVSKATPVLSWATPAAITYGTALSSTQLNATSSVAGTFTYSPAAGATLGTGTTTLSVSFAPTDSSYSSANATVSLVVNKVTPVITWAAPAAITSGTALSSAQLNATASVPGTFVYSPAAGTVPSAGTTTLSATFTPTDSTNYSTKTAAVSLVVNGAAPTITWSAPAAISYGTALSSTQLNATASMAGTFAYSPAAGTVLTTGTQSLKVTFTPTDKTYSAQTASVSLVVNKATPTITWATPAAISSGTALSATQLNATTSVPGTFAYSPAAGAVPSAGTTTLSTTFTPTDAVNYSSATATVSLVVNSASPTITWATPAAITYGTALSATQLNATASMAGTFAYSPAVGTVLTAGTQTLKVTFTPTDKTYTAQTSSVSLVVNKATPTITWSNPVSIVAGIALSATQLNATASVAGTFTYSPALGVILGSGANTLTATFTPTDTTNYSTATASVSISVTGGSSGSTTNIAVGTTAAQTGVKRLGMNIAGQAYYDSSQMLKNLIFRNPGFEGEIWQSILKCSAATSTSCTDSNVWSQWPANFFQGASFEYISGKAKGQTGTITSNTASSNGNAGVTISYSATSATPAAGDYVIVRNTVPGNPQAGWWTSVSGGATLAPEYSDLSPSTPGKQALRVTATGSGQSASVASYFDSYASRSFVQMNGSYKITFRAKGVGGSSQLGLSFVRSLASSNEIFVNQTVALTSSWQDYTYTFTASETGSSIGPVKLEFDVSGSSVLLDDVSVTPSTVTSGNPTPFRDEVVTALKTLNPGVLRYNDGSNTGSTIDNIIAPAFARQRAGAVGGASEFDDVALGLHEFLQLCQTVGAEPYYNMPPTTSPTEMQNLIQYLAGDSSTTYGAKRTALGQAAPWTSVFPVIHLELGNEQWNSGTFPDSSIDDPVAYGNRVATVFGAAKSSPYYSASSFDLVMGGWSDVPWWNQQEIANSSNFDSFSTAPYLFTTLNDTSSTEAIFGPMFAQPEMVDSVSTGSMNQNAAVAKAGGTKVVVYEVNLSTLSGTANQATLNSAAASLGSGLALADHMLLMIRDLGITSQMLWALPGYSNSFSNTATGASETSPLFGSVIDMGGQTNLRRPTYLAEQLANTAILPTMLTTTLSGANPTWVQALSTNDSIQLSGAHELQSFAFTDGGSNRSVIVFNLSRTTARPVTFSGSNIPTGTVNVGQLTSANITDTNESASNVKITTTTLSNFQPSTAYSLPPYSMTVFTWQQ